MVIYPSLPKQSVNNDLQTIIKFVYAANKSSWAQELHESRGGHPGLPIPNSPYGLCECKATLNSMKSIHFKSIIFNILPVPTVLARKKDKDIFPSILINVHISFYITNVSVD